MPATLSKSMTKLMDTTIPGKWVRVKWLSVKSNTVAALVRRGLINWRPFDQYDMSYNNGYIKPVNKSRC